MFAKNERMLLMKPPLLYRFLKWYVFIGLRLFYRKLTIRDVQNVPQKGPVIFAINHQNAFMDAIVIATASSRNPWFLTRASVFDSAKARYWLRKLQMIPIYRFRDGHTNMKKNDEALETCKRLLTENETILIFPEGNHDCKWALRPLQKGIARIGFDTESALNFASGLKIVPVGLQYENYKRSWSDLLVSFGKPIELAGYQTLYEENPARAINLLLLDLRIGMESLIVDIQNTENHDELKQAIRNRPGRESNLVTRLQNDQQFLRLLQEEITIKVEKTEERGSSKSCIIYSILYYISLTLHIGALGLINLILKRFVKDHHWAASMKIATLLFGAPIVYFAQGLLLWSFTSFWPFVAAYLLLLPITALIVLHYRSACLK